MKVRMTGRRENRLSAVPQDNKTTRYVTMILILYTNNNESKTRAQQQELHNNSKFEINTTTTYTN